MATPTPPVVTSITFDQAAYAAGSKITVTVVYVPGTSGVSQTLTGTALDSSTGESGVLTQTFAVINSDTTTISVADTGNRTWTLVSNSGGSAVFTAIA